MKKTGWITFAAAAAASLLLLAAGCGNAAGGGEGGGPLPENGTIMLERKEHPDGTDYSISVRRTVNPETKNDFISLEYLNRSFSIEDHVLTGHDTFVIAWGEMDGIQTGMLDVDLVEYDNKIYNPKYDTIVIKGPGSAKIAEQGNPEITEYGWWYRNSALISIDQIREISEFGSITVGIAAPPDGEATETFQLPATFASYIKQYLLQ